MKKIITYGSFDLLHYGHIMLLKRAKKLGDYLIVAVSSDNFNKEKGKITKQPLKKRIEILESIKYIDKIIIEESWDQKENDIKKYNIHTFVMGDDWKGKFDNLNCKVIYLSRTPEISSSLIKGVLKK